MKVGVPTLITTAMLQASSIGEADAAQAELLWSASDPFDNNQLVIDATTHTKYKSLSGRHYDGATFAYNNSTGHFIVFMGMAMAIGDKVIFRTTGTLPQHSIYGPYDSINVNTNYWVVADTGTSAFNVAISNTPGGSPLTAYQFGSFGTPTSSVYIDNRGGSLSDATKYQRIGPSNRWSMFDQLLNSPTKGVGSVSVTLKPGFINCLGAFNLKGFQARVTMTNAGITVYDRTQVLDASRQAGWYEYFFSPIAQLPSFGFTDLPPYLNGIVTVTVIGANTASPVEIGELMVGLAYELGTAKKGAKAGMKDYTRKGTDDFGNVIVILRPFADTVTAETTIYDEDANFITELLKSLRGTVCMWFGVPDNATYNYLNVCGFMNSFEVDKNEETAALLSLQLEGTAR